MESYSPLAFVLIPKTAWPEGVNVTFSENPTLVLEVTYTNALRC